MTQIPGTSDQWARPGTARIGVVVGGISIAFSTLCFLITPAFTPAFMLALLFGALSGALALALKARRTAVLAFVFALTPLCGFLLMEYVAERVRTGYIVFVPLGLAFAIAVGVLVNYSKARRTLGAG
jgi:hypothetical protein